MSSFLPLFKINSPIFIFVVLVLFFLTCFRLFYGINTPPVERWDEETNISVIEDSISSQTFPVLMLHGKPFFEKPPLWYWINIFLRKVIDSPVLVARLTSGFAGLISILATVLIAKKLWGNVAALTTWIVLIFTNQLYLRNVGGLFSTHTFTSADVDSLQIMFIILGFYCCLQVLLYKQLMGMAGLLCGLAILVKGPLGSIPIIGIFLFSFIKKQKITWRYWIIVFTCIGTVGPWYIYMFYLYGNDFFYNHFLYHLTLRTLVALEGHVYPPWQYGFILLDPLIFPAGIPLIISLGWILKKSKTLLDVPSVFMLTLLFLTFSIPTIMNTRLSWYILPFYPFASLCIGFAVSSTKKTTHYKK